AEHSVVGQAGHGVSGDKGLLAGLQSVVPVSLSPISKPVRTTNNIGTKIPWPTTNRLPKLA
ncbi:MAG: hypothetical protein KDB00_15545, partial [Planctomycetales bacterium]|nr:hypothetical protein [Planctomycetales bacterium]